MSTNEWMWMDELCPICNQEETNHRSNCPNRPLPEKKVKKVKKSRESY
jgi:hypothetical protein